MIYPIFWQWEKPFKWKPVLYIFYIHLYVLLNPKWTKCEFECTASNKKINLSSQMRDQRVDYLTNLRSNLFLCSILADLQPLSEFNPAFTSMANSRIRVVPHHPVTHLSSMKCLLFKTHRLVLPIKDFYHASATKSRCTYGTHWALRGLLEVALIFV